jgi:hypothetical protein
VAVHGTWSQLPGTSVPSLARVYDVALGGKDNFEVDRRMFRRLSAVYPEYRDYAVANRHFLVHAVERAATAGIAQFLDLGSGLPTAPAVHQVARAIRPEAAVAYIDNDPVVRAHTSARAGQPGVVSAGHDLRDAAAVLGDPAVRGVLDLDRPVALLLVAVLHFVEHAEALDALAAYRAALAPGSVLVVSAHLQHPDRDRPDQRREGGRIVRSMGATIVPRSPAQVEELFTGFTLLPPGVQDLAHWRPQGERSRPVWCAGGIAHLP